MGFENGRVLRVALRAAFGDDSQVNTFHYDLDDSGSVGPNDPQSLADTFRDDVLPGFKALYVSAWTIDPVVVTEEKDPQDPTAPRSQWTSGSAGPGTATISSDLMPRACCVLVQLKTAHIGRRFRGRNFIGGAATESVQNDGQWTTARTDFIDTFMDTIPRQPDISPPTSDSTAKWSVYSRTQRAANLDPYLSEITAAVVKSDVHWLKSRRQF